MIRTFKRTIPPFMSFGYHTLEEFDHATTMAGGLVRRKGCAIGGAIYEDLVYNTIKSSALPLVELLPKGNASDNTSVDLPLRYIGQSLPVETKKKGAQMGGTSAYYSRDTSSFTGLAKNVDDADLILLAARAKIPALNAYIDAARELEPTSTITGMPITLDKSTYVELGQRKLQAQAAAEVVYPISFLRDFYNQKGIYYIQIEDSGFFSLGGNPFNFPIPELEANFKLEFRIGPAGGGGRARRSAGYRIQGRLHNLNKSPYSLDNAENCSHLFSREWTTTPI